MKYTIDDQFTAHAWWCNLGEVKRHVTIQKYKPSFVYLISMDCIPINEICEMYNLEMFERIKVKVDLGLKFEYKFSEN